MFLDLTVVYLAFGAPVGVYEITRRRSSLRTVAAAAVRITFWPLFAGLSLRRSLTETPQAELSIEFQIDATRREIEEAVFIARSDASRREFRDALATYVGLALARAGSGQTIGQVELLSAAGRARSAAAAACIARRNRRRLEFHLVAARNDLREVLDTRNAPLQVTSRLATLLNDPDLDAG